MKKRKLLNIFILIFVCVFLFKIETKAEIVECNYEYTDKSGNKQTKKMKIEYGYGEEWMRCQFEDGKVFYPLQRLVYNEDDSLFYLDSEQRYYKQTNGGYTNSCPSTISVYSGKQIKVSIDYSFAPVNQQVVSFSPTGKFNDVTTNMYPNADLESIVYEKILENSPQVLSYSLIKGEEKSEGINDDETKECEYQKRNDNNTYKFKFKAVGDIGYFYTDNGWTKIYSQNSNRISDCPKAVNYNPITGVYYFTEADSCDEDNNCYFRENDSSYYLDQKVYTYVLYANSSSPTIKIKVSKKIESNDKDVIIYFGEDSNTTITVDNIDKYIDVFKSKSIDGIPKYIVLQGSTYIFSDKRPDNFEKIYLYEGYLNKTGLGEEQEYKTCEELFGNGETSDFLDFIKNEVLKFIWIGVAVLLILLTSFDFAKVVFSDDKDGMKKAFDNFKKRAVAAILIFLTPTIIILIINLIAPDQESIQDCVKTIRNMSQTSEIINTNLTK